jgi:hypothetical protein
MGGFISLSDRWILPMKKWKGGWMSWLGTDG